MKLLFYINAIHEGGAERVMANLTAQFAEAGNEVILLTSFIDAWEYPVASNVRRLTMEQEEIKKNKLIRNYTRIKKLRAICKQEKPDALISFMAEPNFRAVIATANLPVKTIVSVRNDPNREYAGTFGKFLGKLLMPLADGCIFQTGEAKAWFPKRLQRKSVIIMNEVAEHFFAVERRNPRNVVTLGRLSEQKNQALLLRAFAKIAPIFPDEKLLIYGNGNCKESLEKQIIELGLEGRALLMGNTSQVEEVLAEAAVFVLSSDYEGLPNALMEALAAGVPSISTDCPCGGPRMLIEHEKNGLLVPVNNEEALVAAMERLLGNPEIAKKIGSAAKKEAIRYSPELIFKQWKDYVESIVEERNQ